jgi:regulator of protease activity HflC (stomatin/prohibitin superfamily)
LNADVLDAVINDADIKNAPVIIDGVQIEDISFSSDYIHSVEQRMQAEVEVQKLQQQALQAEVQAKITVTQAKAKADAVVAQATADATATKLRGEAEGEAIRAKGDALKDNPALVMLTQAEKWNGVLPITMVPGGSVPMLALGR